MEACTGYEKVTNCMPAESTISQPVNRNLFAIVPTAAKGFSTLGAPVAVLEYPQELFVILEELASSYPLDLLHPTLMLLALHIWYYITDSPTRMSESFLSNSDRHRVPDVDLEVFIIYFTHYLRRAEYLRLLHFMHLFRYVRIIHKRRQQI